jgi:hypothetical protein
VLLSTDARALRKSVGFFGRLLGRDIELQAESAAMRGQLALLVLQARQRGEALDRHNHALASLRDRLSTLANEFDAVIASLAATASDAATDHARLRLLESTRLGCALTATQLGVLVQNGQALSARYQHMLPQVEGLLVQHRAALAGRDDAARMRDAAALVASVEVAIRHPYHRHPKSSRTPHRSRHDHAQPRIRLPAPGRTRREIAARPGPDQCRHRQDPGNLARVAGHHPRQPARLRPRGRGQDQQLLDPVADKVRNADLDNSGDKLGEVVRIARSLNLDSFGERSKLPILGPLIDKLKATRDDLCRSTARPTARSTS